MDKIVDYIWRGRNASLRAANGTSMKCLGSINLKMYSEIHDKEIMIDAIVTSDLTDDILISWHDLVEIGMLPSDFPYSKVNQVEVVTNPEKEEPDIFESFKKEFNDVLGDTLNDASGKIKGTPMNIYQKKNLLRRYTTNQIPTHFQEAADS